MPAPKKPAATRSKQAAHAKDKLRESAPTEVNKAFRTAAAHAAGTTKPQPASPDAGKRPAATRAAPMPAQRPASPVEPLAHHAAVTPPRPAPERDAGWGASMGATEIWNVVSYLIAIGAGYVLGAALGWPA